MVFGPVRLEPPPGRLWRDDQVLPLRPRSLAKASHPQYRSWYQYVMRGYGILVYWHLETNAVCIYSQLRGQQPPVPNTASPTAKWAASKSGCSNPSPSPKGTTRKR
jgi:hypothetical protein